MSHTRILCTTLLAFTAGHAAAQQVPYEAGILRAFNAGTVMFPECTLHRVNDRGVAIGVSTDGSAYVGFRWDRAAGMVRAARGTDLNDRDEVVHFAAVTDLRSGQTTVIPPANPARPIIFGLAINDRRTVVGRLRDTSTSSLGRFQSSRAFVWDDLNGTRELAVTDARTLVDVNDAGLAVGHIQQVSTHSEIFVIDLATGALTNLSRLLPSNPLATNGYDDEVIAVSEAGHVVGRAWDGAMTRAFVWQSTTGFTWLPGLGGGDPFRVTPYGVNARGQVVGSALDANLDTRAFVYDAPTGMRDLNALATFPPGIRFQRATRINEAGWIVGNAIEGNWSPPLGVVMRPAFCQRDVGFAGPGAVRLEVCGHPLQTGSAADLFVHGAPADALGLYVLGFHNQPTPMLGGSLVPSPSVVTAAFFANARGRHFVYGAVPGGGGFQAWLQALVLDPSLPQLVAFSNAVELTFQ